MQAMVRFAAAPPFFAAFAAVSASVATLFLRGEGQRWMRTREASSRPPMSTSTNGIKLPITARALFGAHSVRP